MTNILSTKTTTHTRRPCSAVFFRYPQTWVLYCSLPVRRTPPFLSLAAIYSLSVFCHSPFHQDDERLSEDSTILLLRTLLKLACEPGILGAMSVGPSNIDPAFWVRGLFLLGFVVV